MRLSTHETVSAKRWDLCFRDVDDSRTTHVYVCVCLCELNQPESGVHVCMWYANCGMRAIYTIFDLIRVSLVSVRRIAPAQHKRANRYREFAWLTALPFGDPHTHAHTCPVAYTACIAVFSRNFIHYLCCDDGTYTHAHKFPFDMRPRVCVCVCERVCSVETTLFSTPFKIQ